MKKVLIVLAIAVLLTTVSYAAVIRTFDNSRVSEVRIVPTYDSGGNITGATLHVDGIGLDAGGNIISLEYQADYAGLPQSHKDACKLLFNAGGEQISQIIGENESPQLP